MDANNQKLYLEREHRFSVVDLKNISVSVQRSEENGGEECSADLLDFSRKGVKLLLPISVRFEETVKLDFKFQNSEITYSGLAQIRHIRSDENQGWQVGCSVQPSIADEVISFLASSSGKERRRHPRIPVSGQGTLQRQGETEATKVKLQNISEGGFCLSVPNHHNVGERVKLEILNWEDELQVIDSEIRWQVSTLLGYFVGCSFTEVDGFEKIANCVVETRPRSSSINRFVMALAIVTMLLPSMVYLMTYSNDSFAKAEMTPTADLNINDPKPTFIPLRDRPVQSVNPQGIEDLNGDQRSTPSNIDRTSHSPDLPVTQNPVNTQLEDSEILMSEFPSGEFPGQEFSVAEFPFVQFPFAEMPKNEMPDPEFPFAVHPFGEQPIATSAFPINDPFPNTFIEITPKNGLNQPLTVDKHGPQPEMPTEQTDFAAIKVRAPLRMWTDDSGLYRIEAALVKILKDTIELRSFDGTLKTVPINRLCAEDREYLLQWTSPQ